MEEKEKKFIKEINVDKAKNQTNLPILLIVISIMTYIIPLMCGEFDFGIVFEIISLIFLIIARNYMSKYDEIRAKRYIIYSMVAIGWIFIYDIICMIPYIQDIVDLTIWGYNFFSGEVFTILYLIILFSINKYLSKADNPEMYKESTDWFYEKYEEKENGDNRDVGR